MAETSNPGGTEGRAIALSALQQIAARKPPDERLTDLTLERVVDIAWRYQFSPADRAKARSEIREALQPEVTRRLDSIE